MLLNAQDEDGSRMTDTQLQDEIITLFLAGHETTAIVLSTWYLLSKNTLQVTSKLAEKLKAFCGDALHRYAMNYQSFWICE